ncbi:MAG TPA: SRPBCC family protein [Actinomycetes bacterium]|nr:SRPBCC family protein [Actinomycetes bacterium]
MAELVLTQDVDAPAEQVWEVLTDWAVHDRWMLLTRAEGDRAEGGEIRAFTGVGRVGFLDSMTITVWEPPRRAVVRHTGKVVRGSGAFEVEDLGAGRSRVVWSEWVLLPLGAVGQLAWPVVRIPLRLLLQASLRRLARYVVTQP